MRLYALDYQLVGGTTCDGPAVLAEACGVVPDYSDFSVTFTTRIFSGCQRTDLCTNDLPDAGCPQRPAQRRMGRLAAPALQRPRPWSLAGSAPSAWP